MAVTAEEWTTKPVDMISPGVRPPRGAEWGAVSKWIAPFRFLLISHAKDTKEGKLELGKLEDIGCEDCSESEKGLEDEATTDGEGIVATVVAFFVETVDRFEPPRRLGEQIAESC